MVTEGIFIILEKAKFEKTLPYKCILCDNTNVLYFNEIDELKEHINAVHRTEPLNTNVHEGEQKRFKCSLCESRFSKTNDLRRHISSVHEGKRLYQCDNCEKSFKESGHLKSHIRRIHEGLKPHQCTFCDKKFAAISSLKSHVSSVHEVKNSFQTAQEHLEIKPENVDYEFPNLSLPLNSMQEGMEEIPAIKEEYNESELGGDFINDFTDCKSQNI